MSFVIGFWSDYPLSDLMYKYCTSNAYKRINVQKIAF